MNSAFVEKKKIITKTGKVALQVLISRDIYRDLIEIAPLVYGKSRGSISYVVEQALRQYLSLAAHTNTHKLNPKGSVRQVYGQVIEKVKEIMHLDFKPMQVPEKILDLAIMQVRGSDPRTIEKWKAIFERSGLIKTLGGCKPNRVFELL